MAVREALLDTSVLIEHFRNKDKHTTVLFRTMHQGTLPRISVITRFEVLLGATMVQRKYWQDLFDTFIVHSLDDRVADQAVVMAQHLRKKGVGDIGMADLFIASTAMVHGLPLCTLNKRHFMRVEGLAML